MNIVWLQMVVSGVLLIVVTWRTLVDVIAATSTQIPNDHPLSMASFIIIRLIVIFLLALWFVLSWRKSKRTA